MESLNKKNDPEFHEMQVKVAVVTLGIIMLMGVGFLLTFLTILMP